MKIKYFAFLLVTLMLTCGISSAQDSDKPGSSTKTAIIEKGTGVYFETEISSKGSAAVIWKNWRDGGRYRGESDLGGSPTITIVADGFSYSLSPNIKVARKSKLVTDENKNPLMSKYSALADIPQLDPVNYVAVVRRLGGQIQGPTDLDGNKADLYSLKITDSPKFPWNNFMIWIDKVTLLPLKIQYQEGSEVRIIKFLKIEKNIKVDENKFKVPTDYKLIEFEWD
jgi:outer membrane lipoprotein-sorting protein